MHKFKIGDKVRVRKDLVVDKYYGCGFTERMEQYCGNKAKITRVSNTFYDLDIDNGEFAWTDDMLEPVTTTTEQPKYVKCINNTGFEYCLKIGEIYKIKEINKDYHKCVGHGDGYELKGKGYEGNIYYSDRFEIVSSPEPKIITKPKKSTIKIRQTGNVTYATYNGVYYGEAIRKSSDKYDEKIGILLSVARALNIDEDKIKGIIDVLFDEDKKEVELSNADIDNNSYTNLDFKIGDRVIGLGSVDDKTINGIKGTIIDLSSHSKYKYGIKFDKDIDGHSLYGKCPYGYGYFVRKQDIKLLPKDEEEIAKLQKENKELKDTINKIKSLLLANDIIGDM